MGSIGENPASIREKFDEFFAKKNIEEQCTAESLDELHEAFLAADEARMDESQLQEAFDNILKIRMKPEEMHTLFTKINSKRNGFVTWDEFVSHVMLEFQDKDISWQWQVLEPPLTGLPILMKTHHRSPITRILFCPEILPDRTSNFLRGYYITASRDGIINYWSLDLEYRRTVQSVNPFRKVRPTVITDVIAMPDVQIVCTSSTERDLRFYDTMAKKFDLRVMISRLECPVVCMGYYFSVDISDSSYILLGNTSGSVIIMSFNPCEKGPFKHFPHQEVAHHRYEAVVKGDLAGLQVTEFRNVHSNWLSQVSYYAPLRAFVSCSKCSKCSLLLSDPTGTKMQYKFIVEKGISCCIYCEENQLLITGGPDCTVRMWNPFVTRKPSMILTGHHAAICAIVVQNSGKRLYTLAKDRCIKVWDVGAQSCIQTYNGLPGELGEHTDLSIIYNDVTHEMIIASMMIAVIVCERVIDQEASDGFTHTQAVSCVLYNSLFKVIVSVGLDSCIIVWDPWLGRRLHFVTKAHSQLHFGQKIGVEITAACFDTTEQLLLTGARDGTLKLWNFNTGTCLRTMSVEENCEITCALWLKNRILCAGWDRRVTEFADTDTGTHKKSWEIRHTEHVLCASVSYPQALATASSNGEIVLWRLETGQPYRRYQVSDPTRRYKIVYRREPKFDAPKAARLKTARRHVASKVAEASTIPHIDETQIDRSALAMTNTVSVRSIMFLASRECNPETGSFLVSLQSGLIQVWTHHTAAGFLTAFTAVHTQGDYALSLATDPDNEFLVTGHAAGYIKVWLLKNYVVPNPPKVCVPLLRLEFTFMWRDRILGRAKRAIRDQPLPILLSSIKGHTSAINSLQFIPEARIVVSGSEDHTVRLWTLNGRYISTLGTFRSWATILPDTPASEYLTNYRIPPDIERVASSTTMKVLRGGSTEKRLQDLTEKPESKVKVSETERHLLYGEPFDTDVIKQYCDRPETTIYDDTPILDNSLAYVTRDVEVIEAPPKPAVLQKQGPIRALMTALSHFKKTIPTERRDKSAPRRRDERGGASEGRRRAKRKERPRPRE